jgi:hypothetical protein
MGASMDRPLCARGRSGVRALAALALLATAGPLGCTAAPAVIPHGVGPAARVLMVRGAVLRTLLGQDQHLASAFAGRTTYVTSPGPAPLAALRMAGVIEPTADYTSFAAFAADLAAGRLPKADHAVLYDIEKWSATPTDEQQNPRAYMDSFARLARAHGLLPILAPARDLVLVPGGSCVKRAGESVSDAYLRCGLAGADAHAAVLVVQSQAEQSDPAAFRGLLAQAVRQARAGNPGISVLGQLATAPLGRPAPLAGILAAGRSVAPLVQGFSLNLRAADAPVAEGLLSSLRRP